MSVSAAPCTGRGSIFFDGGGGGGGGVGFLVCGVTVPVVARMVTAPSPHTSHPFCLFTLAVDSLAMVPRLVLLLFAGDRWQSGWCFWYRSATVSSIPTKPCVPPSPLFRCSACVCRVDICRSNCGGCCCRRRRHPDLVLCRLRFARTSFRFV